MHRPAFRFLSGCALCSFNKYSAAHMHDGKVHCNRESRQLVRSCTRVNVRRFLHITIFLGGVSFNRLHARPNRCEKCQVRVGLIVKMSSEVSHLPHLHAHRKRIFRCSGATHNRIARTPPDHCCCCCCCCCGGALESLLNSRS